MPVNYVAPSPVANEATMAGLLAPRYATGGGGGGGYGGGGGGGPWGQVIQLRGDPTAELQHRMNSQALGGAIAGNLALTERGTRLDLQQQGAELDVWQFNQKVTAQEAAQLRADERAVAAIRNDPTLSPAEKIEGIRRIQTRIDWVSERQKRDLQQAQAEMAQSHAQAYKMQAEMEEGRLKFATAEINGKLRTIVDDDAAEELTALFKRLYPQASPEEVGKLVTKEAIRQGRATRYAANPDGSVDLRTGQRFGAGGAGLGQPGKGAPGSSGSGGGGGGELGPMDFVKIRQNALDNARKEQPDGPLSEEFIDAHFRALLKGVDEYKKGTPEGKAVEAKAEQVKHAQNIEADLRSLAPYLDQSAAFEATRNPQARAQYQLNQGKAQAMMELVRLYREFPDPTRMPSPVADRIRELKENLERLKNVQFAQRPPASPVRARPQDNQPPPESNTGGAFGAGGY
jgi:hypothetical protein